MAEETPNVPREQPWSCFGPWIPLVFWQLHHSTLDPQGWTCHQSRLDAHSKHDIVAMVTFHASASKIGMRCWFFPFLPLFPFPLPLLGWLTGLPSIGFCGSFKVVDCVLPLACPLYFSALVVRQHWVALPPSGPQLQLPLPCWLVCIKAWESHCWQCDLVDVLQWLNIGSRSLQQV